MKTVLGQQRADVTIEINRILSTCDRRNSQQPADKNTEKPDPTSDRSHGRSGGKIQGGKEHAVPTSYDSDGQRREQGVRNPQGFPQ